MIKVRKINKRKRNEKKEKGKTREEKGIKSQKNYEENKRIKKKKIVLYNRNGQPRFCGRANINGASKRMFWNLRVKKQHFRY